MTGDEATLTAVGSVVAPGVTATVLTMVVPGGTLSTVGADDGGIFCVAAAAAARAAMPLIWGLLPITCGAPGPTSTHVAPRGPTRHPADPHGAPETHSDPHVTPQPPMSPP